MYRHFTAALTAVALILTTAACSKKEAGGTVYAVSIEPQRWLLEQLVDSTARVVTMLPAGANPETFDPPMSLRAQVENSGAYFATGALPFETAFQEVTDVPFYDTSEGIERIFGTHDHFRHHEAGESHSHEGESDPHFWTSVSGARKMAANMAAALKEINPDKAQFYDSRLAALGQSLDSINSAIEATLAGVTSRTFAVWHPSLSYYANDYGLHQLAVGQEGKEMSARQMRDVIDEAKADSVRVFFFQRQYDARQARTLNDAIGSRLVTVDPLAYDWDKQMLLITDELAKP